MSLPQESSRGKRLLQLIGRIQRLLEQQEDPQASMRWMEGRLASAGLNPALRLEEPQEFAADLLGCLESADRDQFRIPSQPMRRYQDLESLVLDMLPNPER